MSLTALVLAAAVVSTSTHPKQLPIIIEIKSGGYHLLINPDAQGNIPCTITVFGNQKSYSRVRLDNCATKFSYKRAASITAPRVLHGRKMNP